MILVRYVKNGRGFTLTNGSDTKYGWCECRIVDIIGAKIEGKQGASNHDRAHGS